MDEQDAVMLAVHVPLGDVDEAIRVARRIVDAGLWSDRDYGQMLYGAVGDDPDKLLKLTQAINQALQENS